MQYFPLFLRGSRMKVLLVGGGTIAAAKLETLAASEADITIVAPLFSTGLRSVAERYGCRLLQQSYTRDLLEACNLVVAATDDPALGKQIADDARAIGIWANIVDNPENCDFIFPAIIRQGALQVAISTGGASPVIARLLKQDIEQDIPPYLGDLFPFIAERNPKVREELPAVQKRRLFWERVIRGPIGRMLSDGQVSAAERWFNDALKHARDGENLHALDLISVSDYDPDALTVRVVRRIGRADVLLYEGGEGMLPLLDRYARRDAEKYAVAQNESIPAAVEPLLSRGIVVYLAGPTRIDISAIQRQLEVVAQHAGSAFSVFGAKTHCF